MKLGDHLKKIFNSYDFRGNRIKNLRVDTPSEKPDYKDPTYNEKKDFVANKEYVDKVTTYDTELVNKWKIPFIQKWMGDVSGLGFKDLLDRLLFQRIPPTYYDPIITDVKLSVFDAPLINGRTILNNDGQTVEDWNINSLENKYLLILEQQCFCRFHVELKPNDRISGVSGRIVITDSNDNILHQFTSIQTNDTVSDIECKFTFQKGMKFRYEKQFTSAVVKQDTYNEDSPISNTSYLLTEDLTDLFYKQCLIIPMLIIKLIRNNENDSFIGADIDTFYIKSNKIYCDASREIIADFALPKILSCSNEGNNNHYLKYIIYDYNESVHGSGRLEFNNLKVLGNFTYNGFEYTVYRYNFGMLGFNTIIKLIPEFIEYHHSN